MEDKKSSTPEESEQPTQFLINELLKKPGDCRDVSWLKDCLQVAVQVELSTIPPYLTAMWSIVDTSDEVYEALLDIVLEEMFHMGMVCNLLTSIGGMPVIARSDVVPKYPGYLPGGIHPALKIGLERISKSVVETIFMEIEKPDVSPITWYRGRPYHSIGAFYDAIYAALECIDPSSVSPTHQMTTTHTINITAINNRDEALEAIKLIKEQGEGTQASPYYGPSIADLAHYFKFGEVFHGQKIEVDGSGHWDYTGDPVRFPDESSGEIHLIAPVPPGGYPSVTQDFDELYSGMLRDLEAAWADDDQARLDASILTMKNEMTPLALELMQKRIPSSAEFYSPSFIFYPT